MDIYVCARNFRGGLSDYKVSYGELTKFLFKLPSVLDSECHILKENEHIQIQTEKLCNFGHTRTRAKWIDLILKDELLSMIRDSHEKAKY